MAEHLKSVETIKVSFPNEHEGGRYVFFLPAHKEVKGFLAFQGRRNMS